MKIWRFIVAPRAEFRRWIGGNWDRYVWFTASDNPQWFRWLVSRLTDTPISPTTFVFPLCHTEVREWFERDRIRGTWWHCTELLPPKQSTLDLLEGLRQSALGQCGIPRGLLGIFTARSKSADIRQLEKVEEAILRFPIIGASCPGLVLAGAQTSAPKKETLVTFQLPGAEPNMNGDSIDPQALRNALQKFVGKKNDAASRGEIVREVTKELEQGRTIHGVKHQWVASPIAPVIYEVGDPTGPYIAPILAREAEIMSQMKPPHEEI